MDLTTTLAIQSQETEANHVHRIGKKFMRLFYTALIKSILCTCFLILPQIAKASDYYISPTGSDAETGTRQFPWQTLKKGLQSVSPGDALILLEGKYTEDATTSIDGNSEAYITITAESNAVFQASLTIKNPYYKIKKLESTGHFILDGTNASYCVIESNYMHDTFYMIDVRAVRPQQTNGPHSNIFRSNILSNSISLHMMNLTGYNNLVESNRFQWSNGFDCLRVFGVNHVIRGNTFENINMNPTEGNHTDVFQSFGVNGEECYDILIDRNLIVDSQAQLCNLAIGNTNLNAVRNWTFQNNLVVNSIGQCNVYVPNVKFINNTFFRCTANTVLQFKYNNDQWTRGTPDGAMVVNNIFAECGSVENQNYGFYSITPEAEGILVDYNFVTGRNGAKKSVNEQHGINGGSVGFVNSVQLDLRLSPSSPAINAGIKMVESQFDFSGNDRNTKLKYDIGAYAYLSTLLKKPGNFRVIQTN